MTKITAHDIEKGATYKHKEILKQHGFQWNKTERKWQKDGWIPATIFYAGLQLGIKTVPITKEILRDMVDEWERDGENAINDPEGHDAPVDPARIYTNDDIIELPEGETIPEDIEEDETPAIKDPGVTFYTHKYPDERFNHGAYLNSRVNSKEPLDKWYKDKLVKEIPNLAMRYLVGRDLQLGTHVIISIQDYKFKGKEGTNVCIYSVDYNDVIIDKAKLTISKKKKEDA